MINHDLLHVMHVLQTLHDEAINRVLGRLPQHLRQQFNDRFTKAESVRESLVKVMAP